MTGAACARDTGAGTGASVVFCSEISSTDGSGAPGVM